MKIIKIRSLMAALILFVSVTHAAASGFEVVPIKLYLDFKTKSGDFTITNVDEQKLVIQIIGYAWTQDENGVDKHDETNDIIFFPKIVNLEKGQKGTIRIGYNGNDKPEREKAYRLLIKQLPVSAPGEQLTLAMALNIAVPIFFRPVETKFKGAITGAAFTKNGLSVSFANEGNVHYTVEKLDVTGLDGNGAEVFSNHSRGWYVFPGRTKSFNADISRADCLGSAKIRVDAKITPSIFDKATDLDIVIDVDKEQCPEETPPEGEKEKTK